MKRKYTLPGFAAGDFKAVERYLNEQAQKGWELERIGLCAARWKRTERTDLRWCVDLADPKQSREDRKDYVDFCAEGGWELAAFYGNMYFFKSLPGREVIPIQTDPELEKKNYNRYYVRNTILSAIGIVAMLAFYALAYLGLNRDLEYTVQTTKLEWHRHWLAVGAVGALLLWGLWLVWRPLDFLRALLSNRRGGIAESPRAVMWVNCGVNALGFLGAVLFFGGLLVECTVQADFAAVGFVYPITVAVCLFFRAFLNEFELYKGERGLLLRLACLSSVVFALMVVGRVSLPVGEWSSNPFSTNLNADKAEAQFSRLGELPLVRAEDLGIVITDDPYNYEDLLREYTPVGERMELEYSVWGEDSALTKIGCETYLCPTEGLAHRTAGQILKEIQWWSDSQNRESVASYLVIAAPPQVEMERLELDWADEAWYGENGGASVLVVRVGTRVSRVSAPLPLNDAGMLAVVRERALLGIEN